MQLRLVILLSLSVTLSQAGILGRNETTDCSVTKTCVECNKINECAWSSSLCVPRSEDMKESISGKKDHCDPLNKDINSRKVTEIVPTEAFDDVITTTNPPEEGVKEEQEEVVEEDDNDDKDSNQDDLTTGASPSQSSPKTTPSRPSEPTTTSTKPASSSITTDAPPTTTTTPTITTSIPTTTSEPPTKRPPSSTTTITPPPVDPEDRSSFDGWSFFGGILLTLGFFSIGFVGLKYYRVRSRTDANYNRF